MSIKKIVRCLLALLFWGSGLSIVIGQSCFPDGLTLHSQQAVDNFAILTVMKLKAPF